MQKKPIETLKDAKYGLVHNSQLTVAQQAEVLGISESYLYNSCLDSVPNANHQTSWIIPQTNATKNYILLDYFEKMCGRVGVPVPDVSVSVRDIRSELLKVTAELGEAAEALEDGLKGDNDLNKKERAVCKKEFWDIVTQAMRAYKMMEADNGA